MDAAHLTEFSLATCPNDVLTAILVFVPRVELYQFAEVSTEWLTASRRAMAIQLNQLTSLIFTTVAPPLCKPLIKYATSLITVIEIPVQSPIHKVCITETDLWQLIQRNKNLVTLELWDFAVKTVDYPLTLCQMVKDYLPKLTRLKTQCVVGDRNEVYYFVEDFLRPAVPSLSFIEFTNHRLRWPLKQS